MTDEEGVVLKDIVDEVEVPLFVITIIDSIYTLGTVDTANAVEVTIGVVDHVCPETGKVFWTWLI